MNLLLVRTGGLGDCILTLPVLAGLRDMYPGAEFHILGNRTMLDIARLAGIGSEFRSIDEAGFASLFSGAGTAGFLRSFFSRCDSVWFFTAGDPEGVRGTVLASGARSCRVLDPRPPDGFNGHVSSHLLSILGKPPLEHPPLPSLTLENRPPRIPSRLLIHPGSGSVKKTWPLDRFLAVAERWRGSIEFLLGPAEEERGMGERIPGRWGMLRGLTIEGTARALASAALFLGCDSGMSHLAALCRTPSVVLFGPSDPAVWRPLGKRTTVIVSPDGAMEGIRDDAVFEAVERKNSELS
jgi:ADP-heptose:LPS heptosyltransferase